MSVRNANAKEEIEMEMFLMMLVLSCLAIALIAHDCPAAPPPPRDLPPSIPNDFDGGYL